MSRESRWPSHESRSLIPIFKKNMDNVIKTRLVMDKYLYQDAIPCKTLMFNMEVAHEMT